MFLIDTLILVCGILLLLGIGSSKLSARLGVPVLVLFLLLGMLAGSEGIGGIVFENYALAHGIGSSLKHVEGDIIDYSVGANSRAAGRLVKDLALPAGVVIAVVARDQQMIPPQGSTRIHAGDHVILVMRPGTAPLVNRIFASTDGTPGELPPMFEFPPRHDHRGRTGAILRHQTARAVPKHAGRGDPATARQRTDSPG